MRKNVKYLGSEVKAGAPTKKNSNSSTDTNRYQRQGTETINLYGDFLSTYI